MTNRPCSLWRFDQFVGEQLSLPRQGAGAFEITGLNRGFRLLHELADLIDHLLLVRAELLSGDLLKVGFRRCQHLVGSIPLVRRGAARAPTQLNAGFLSSSLPHNYLRWRTVLRVTRGSGSRSISCGRRIRCPCTGWWADAVGGKHSLLVPRLLVGRGSS